MKLGLARFCHVALVVLLMGYDGSCMEKKTFLEVLEAFQGKTQDVTLRVSAQRFGYDRQAQKWSVMPYSDDCKLIFAGHPGERIRCDIDCTIPSINDAGDDGPPVRMLEQWAFNGKVGTFIRRDPLKPRGRTGIFSQAIMPTDPTARAGLQALIEHCSGRDLITAYYGGKGLAGYLREREGWDLVSLGGDKYLVKFISDERPQLGNVLTVTVDLGLGGAIVETGDIYPGTPGGDGFKEDFGFKNVILKQVADGIWLPVSAEWHMGTILYKLAFKEAEVNKGVAEDTFTLQFEPGSVVSDEVGNARYTVGPPSDLALLDGIDEAINEAREEAPAKITGGVRLSRVSMPPAGHAASSAPNHYKEFLVAIALAVCLAAGAAALIGRRRARRRRAAGDLARTLGLFAVAAALLGSQAKAGQYPEQGASSPYSKDYYGYRVPVFQCGLYAAAVQLRAARIDYDTPVLEQHLDCNAQGTSLGSLARVLEAYGMGVKAVRSLDTKLLARSLSAGETAIIAMKVAGGRSHLLPIMGYRDRNFICIDYPAGCLRVSENDMAGFLQTMGGTGLLIDKPSAPPSAAVGLVPDPSTVDLGDLSSSREDPRVEFRIRNVSSRPRVAKYVRATCGCVRAEVTPKWIDPGTSAVVACTVSRGVWGPKRKAVLYLIFADGTLIPLTIKATQPLSIHEQVSLDPAMLYATDTALEGGAAEYRVNLVSGYADASLAVSAVEPTAPWIDARVGASPDSKLVLATIVVTVRRLDDYGVHTGTVRVFCKGADTPFIVNITQERKYPFAVTPSVIEFADCDLGPKSALVFRVDSTAPLAVDDVMVEVPEVLARGGVEKCGAGVKIALAPANPNVFEYERWAVREVTVRVRQDGKQFDLPLKVILHGRGEDRGGQNS